MNQWTLPSQGLLCQNVEAVFDVLRSVAARRVLAISPHGLNAGARVLSRYCTWMVGLLFFIPVVPHTGWTWYRGFPGTSWSRPVKRQIPPDCYLSEGIGFTHVSVTRLWTFMSSFKLSGSIMHQPSLNILRDLLPLTPLTYGRGGLA